MEYPVTSNIWLLILSSLIICYIAYGCLYRLYLSPLAKFPGPKIVALTSWYECYYDVFKTGTYIWKVDEWHKRYGPIIRISPTELHIADPEFYHTIYAPAPAKRDKYYLMTKSSTCDSATGFTVEHGLHKIRRDATAPFFNKKNTTLLEPRIRDCIEHLSQRMKQASGTGQPVNMTSAFIALSMDVLTEYCFGEAFGLLKQDDFNIAWKDSILGIMRAIPSIRHFPWIGPVVDAVPDSILKAVAIDMTQLSRWKATIRREVNQALAFEGKYAKKDGEKMSLFEELRDSEKLPDDQKTADRLVDETSILLIAGSETPAKTLALGLYHLLANSEQLHRLRTELGTVISDPQAPFPALNTLEKLPFLTACVLESLRLHGGVTGRSPRLSPTPLTYKTKNGKEWVIPANTPLSTQSPFMHYNEDIFPEPRAFKPQRWLKRETPSENKQVKNNDLVIDTALKRYMVAFGAGTRICLGYNLGMATLYYGFTAMALRFDMSLFETDFDDVDMQYDWSVPQPRKADTPGVRVLVDGMRKSI